MVLLRCPGVLLWYHVVLPCLLCCRVVCVIVSCGYIVNSIGGPYVLSTVPLSFVLHVISLGVSMVSCGSPASLLIFPMAVI